MARNNFHEVELNDVAYSVDMNSWTCGCRKWEMVGMPCVHAAAVIIGRKEQVGNYVSDYYKTKTWQETYKNRIRPVQGMLVWPRLNRLPVLPPPWRNGDPGRPSNYARKKGRYETAASSSNTRLSRALRVMTCSNCKQEGHNKKRCPNETAATEPKRTRGRPRKNQVSLFISSTKIAMLVLGCTNIYSLLYMMDCFKFKKHKGYLKFKDHKVCLKVKYKDKDHKAGLLGSVEEH